MDKICPSCAKNPDNHSFKKISDKGNVALYYTKPSSALLYDDTDGILSHIDNMLTLQKGKWSVLFDGKGFDINHATEIRTGAGLVQLLLTKYGALLQEFKIINPTWHITGIIKLAAVALPPDMFAKIKVLEDRKYSVLEFL